MTFLESVNTCFDKYSTLSGKASRSEFWWFTLFVWATLFLIVLALPCLFAPSTVTLVVCFWVLISIIPLVAVSVRRLHDIGKSGWWLLKLAVGYAAGAAVVAGVAAFWRGTEALAGYMPLRIVLMELTAVVMAYISYVMSKPSASRPHDDNGRGDKAEAA